MAEHSVIIWDLETVPDLRAAARMAGIDEEETETARESMGSGFPKPPLHSIACIGALVARHEAEGWRVSALGAPHTGERPEPELIQSFVDRIEQLRPQLVNRLVDKARSMGFPVDDLILVDHGRPDCMPDQPSSK